MSDYDAFARACSAADETNFLNAWYERPSMVDLSGDVEGRRVLDAGCGAGPLTAALREKGAIVSGFDLSPSMIDLARERLGVDADLPVAAWSTTRSTITSPSPSIPKSSSSTGRARS